MALSKELPILNFSQLKQALHACYNAKARLAPLIFGDPGIGKSALVTQFAREVGLPLYTLIGSTCDPTDVGGIPCVINGALQRIPIKQIQEAMKAPAILFLDELTAMPEVTQAPMMRGLLEGIFGDLAIHVDAFVVGAANEPDHAPGASDMAATTGNRVLQFVLQPHLEEIQAYFATLGEPGTLLRAEAFDWAATVSVKPDLVRMSPPMEAIERGAPWASPRAIERGLRAFVGAGAAVGPASGPEPVEATVSRACLAAAWGASAADAYLGIRKLREKLPSVEEILKDPQKAKLPEGTAQIAAMGVLARVVTLDYGAAWIYCARMRTEMAMATCRLLLDTNQSPTTRFGKDAEKAKYALLAHIRREIS